MCSLIKISHIRRHPLKQIDKPCFRRTILIFNGHFNTNLAVFALLEVFGSDLRRKGVAFARCRIYRLRKALCHTGFTDSLEGSCSRNTILSVYFKTRIDLVGKTIIRPRIAQMVEWYHIFNFLTVYQLC